VELKLHAFLSSVIDGGVQFPVRFCVILLDLFKLLQLPTVLHLPVPNPIYVLRPTRRDADRRRLLNVDVAWPIHYQFSVWAHSDRQKESRSPKEKIERPVTITMDKPGMAYTLLLRMTDY
jgi:hypothetical protein